MQVELKTTKLTKSKINQMDYIGVPKNPLVEVLGWVNMDKKRYVIVKSGDSFYRADFINKIEKEVKTVQFGVQGGGWEFPYLNNIKYESYNRGYSAFTVDRDDEKNLELYANLVLYKEKTDVAGQIYY